MRCGSHAESLQYSGIQNGPPSVQNVHVAGQFQIAGHDITALRLKSKHLLRVLLIADADIYILHKVGHDLASLFLGPELFAEV